MTDGLDKYPYAVIFNHYDSVIYLPGDRVQADLAELRAQLAERDARVKALEAALAQAIEDIEEWGAYARRLFSQGTSACGMPRKAPRRTG
jgi:hypothetical protein